MGLCKCPKKKVTNQFCFEHRVNVCEHCMVSNHSKCVVQSYLQWLQDSDYDPNCQMCKTELADGECTRLICYHVFHWTCLDKYASQLPPQTASAGYTCPICNVGIFPSSNMVSPVAEALRNALLGVNWARSGLGFPLIPDSPPVHQSRAESVEVTPTKSAIPSPDGNENKIAAANSNYGNPSHSHKMDMNSSSSRPEPYGASFSTGNFASARKMYDATEQGTFRPTMVDHDEDKYKRRSALEWFGRWFQSRTILGGNRRRESNVFYKRWVVLGMLALIALCTLTILFLRLGRASADSDPLLDPHLNPNIRVQDSVEGMMLDSEKLPIIDKDKAIHIDRDGNDLMPR